MRSLVAALLAALALSAPPARADGTGALELEIEEGGEKVLGGFRPLCDDPTVASFSEDGRMALKGLRQGETTCSVSIGSPLGTRKVYHVVVVPKAPGRGKKGSAPARAR